LLISSAGDDIEKKEKLSMIKSSDENIKVVA
jgi:hypothetical protein